MPIVGDFFTMEFKAPPEKPGTKRTIFSRSTGYYKLHLEENTPDRTAELFFYGMNPGYIVREAVKTFNEMQLISLSGKEAH